MAMVDLFRSQVDYTGYSQMKSMVLTLYNSGLKLIILARQMLLIQLELIVATGNYIKTFINQHIQTPLVLKSFKIKVRDN